MLTDACKSLFWGCPICEVHCPACKSVLPPLHQFGQLNKPSSVKYALYAIIVKYRDLNSPFSWYKPIVYTVDSVSGVLLTVKGSFLSLLVLKSNLVQERMPRMLPLPHWVFPRHSWTCPWISSHYSRKMPN